MAQPDRDLLVVGGGPAGLATAIYAAQAGLSVTVMEKQPDVVDKACGEGLMPGAVAAMESLGVHPAHSHPFHGVRYVSPTASAEARFPSGFGLGIRRLVLHVAMQERAAAVGVERVLADVGEVTQDDDGVMAGGMRGRWLVAADGLRSPIREQLGLSAPPRRAPRVGLRRHFQRAPRDAMVEVHWSPHAEAYITPVGPEQVGIAFLFYADRAPPLPTGVSRYDALMMGFPSLRDWLDGAPVLSSVAGAGPFERRVRHRVAGRILLVGDAAGYLDPLTGEGLRLGFEAAHAAVASIVTGDLATYDRTWRRGARRYWWMTSGLLALARSRLARRLVVPGAAVFPSLMRHSIRLLGGSPATLNGEQRLYVTQKCDIP